MKDQLYKLYIEEKDKELNKKFIEDAFCIMVGRENELENYISNLEIIEDESEVLGLYSNRTKKIKINKKAIETSKEGKCANKNLMTLEIIRHEIEHARNLKTLEEERNDIESLIVAYSMKDYALDQGLNYHNLYLTHDSFLSYKIRENYELNPGERLAEIKSWKYLVNLLKNQRTSYDLLTARSMLYYSYIKGYKDNRYYLDAPTFQFLSNTGMLQELKWLKQRLDGKDYTFETRVTYGLPLTYEEHNEKTLQKVKLRKTYYLDQ